MNILFPSDPLNPKEVNPSFRIEAEVCYILQIRYDIFDYDAFLSGDYGSLDNISEGETI